MDIKGSVEIRLINKDTLEVEQVIKQDNTITNYLRDRIAVYAGSSYGGNYITGGEIVISDDANDSVPDFWWVHRPVWGYTPAGVTQPQAIQYTDVSPSYLQWVKRFDPPSPGTTRTINMVGQTHLASGSLEATSNRIAVNAYVKLNTPVVQSDTQLVDVFYRIQWVWNPAKNSGFNNDPFSGWYNAYYLLNADMGAWPYHIVHSPFPTPYTPDSGVQRSSIMPGVSSAYLGYDPTYRGSGSVTSSYGYFGYAGYSYPLFKRYGIAQGSTSAQVGQIVSSEFYITQKSNGQSWKNVVPPYGDIQPVYSHAAETFASTTPNPFLDSMPATGSGTVQLSGTWTNPDYPELYLIKMTSGGAVGVSTYQMWKRNHTGFALTTYKPRPGVVVPVGTWYMTTNTPNVALRNPLGSHGLINHYQADTKISGVVDQVGISADVYSYTTIVTSDNTGVTVYNIPKHEHKNFDATTTPALPVTRARQVSVNKAAGDVWVACRDTGLWKINVPGNTVTHITVVTHGVPSEQCYGVDVGRNGSVWAMFNGGLASSTDGGTSWTTYNSGTTPAFNYVGISDGNWDSVAYIKVDPAHLDDQMMIVRRVDTTVNTTIGGVWWSRGSATAVAITSSSGGQWDNARLNTTRLEVSDNDSFWVLAGNTSYATKKLTYGSTSSVGTSIGTNNVYLSTVAFEKGPAGQDCYIHVAGSSTSHTITLYDKALTQVVPTFTPLTTGDQTPVNNYATRALYLGKGMFCITACESSSPQADNVTTLVVGILPDTSNSMVGPMSYLIWDKYGWNGTNWELNHAGSKTTHLTPSPLLNGVAVSFQDGATGESFVNGDYYTAGVLKGLWKTNSIVYNTNFSYYQVPTKESTDFNGVVRLCPTTGTVTWKYVNSLAVVNPDNSITNSSTSRPYGLYAVGNNRVFGDFTLVGTVGPMATPHSISFGLTGWLGGLPVTGTTSDWSNVAVNDSIVFTMADNSIAIRVNVSGSSVASASGIVISTPGTSWEIRRVGNTITCYVGGTLRLTYVQPTTDTLYTMAPRVWYNQQTSVLNSQTSLTFPPMTITASDSGYYTQVGQMANGTGIYDPKFTGIDVTSLALPALELYLNGTPVTTKYANTVNTRPAAGEAVILSMHGDIMFNAADAGKTVTGKYVYATK